MRYQSFCVMDKAVGAFLPPFLVRSHGEAIRSFSDACNDAKHQFATHSADYTLFHIGEWDDQSGLYHPSEPTRVVGAIEVIMAAPLEAARSNGSGGRVAM